MGAQIRFGATASSQTTLTPTTRPNSARTAGVARLHARLKTVRLGSDVPLPFLRRRLSASRMSGSDTPNTRAANATVGFDVRVARNPIGSTLCALVGLPMGFGDRLRRDQS